MEKRRLDQLLGAIGGCALFQLDAGGRIVSWNRRARELCGYTAREVIGKSITLLHLSSNGTRVEPGRCCKAASAHGRFEQHASCVRKSGRSFVARLLFLPRRNQTGKAEGFEVFLQDVTLNSEREQRMRAVVDTAVDAIITIDARGAIGSANPATERLFGYRESELLGRNVKMLMPEPYQGEHDQYLRNYLRTGKAKIIGIGREVTAMRKDGTRFPISLAVSELSLGRKPLFTGIVHDLSARRRLEKQIIEASTNEQRRIAQDLHDGLCQELVGIALGADVIAKRLEAQSNPQVGAVRKLAVSVRDVAGQARRLSHGLNPLDLKAGGLGGALDTLARRIAQSFGVACRLRWDGLVQVDNDSSATQLYRIAQESINNAIRHGRATVIEIRLWASGDMLKLSVLDNGIGFPPTPAKLRPLHADHEGGVAHPEVGIGLATMRYRANLIGGIFDVRPRVKSGTAVTVSLRADRAAATPRKIQSRPNRKRAQP